MCMYSYSNGVVDDFQAVHLGARALGGTGLIISEATAVSPEGRISPYDAGIWNDGHITALANTTKVVKSAGAVAAIQLAHSGRKACTTQPWMGGGPIGMEDPHFWQALAPSPIPFDVQYQRPLELTKNEINRIIGDFGNAARRAHLAGFELAEIHAAHGYLIHSFLSPLTNHRVDEYGGSIEKRSRLLNEIVVAVRENLPEDLPVAVRLSCTDWATGGLEIEDTLQIASMLKDLKVDLIDCSSGGIMPNIRIPVAPGYQVRFASEIRNKLGLATAAVGMIQTAVQANQIISDGHADIVLIGRSLLSDPNWAIAATIELGGQNLIPNPYLRGNWRS